MSLKMSTALCNKLHDSNPSRLIFNLGFLKLYSGAAPANADAAAGTLVLTVSNNATGTGLTFDPAAAGGTLPKKTGEVWSGVAPGSGGPFTLTHFRLVAAGDTGVADVAFTQPRLQGTVGTGGTDMVVGNPVVGNGATFTINFATLSFVPS
jgi:hypothetical protein